MPSQATIPALKASRVNRMERRIEISFLCGLSITLALSFLSELAVRLFPYRDLPMMPKPFFVCALLPGFIVGEWLPFRWIGEFVFFVTNSIAYAFATFCFIAIINAGKG